MTITNYQIGLSTGSMVNLGIEVGGILLPAPKGDPVIYSQPTQLADGSIRGLGWMNVDWNFGYLTPSQRDSFRAYVPIGQASNLIYMATRSLDNNNAFVLYQAWCIWPFPEKRDFLYRPDFILKWQRLIAQ
jgi:hypothetical protein